MALLAQKPFRINRIPKRLKLCSTASHFVPLRTYPTPKPLPVKRNLKNFVVNLRQSELPQGMVDFEPDRPNKKRLLRRFAGLGVRVKGSDQRERNEGIALASRDQGVDV
jgi:hypothetical protein